MPSAAVLAPVALPLAAAAVIAIFGLAGFNLGRIAAAAGGWSVVATLLAIWLPVRSSLELTLGQLGYGSAFDLRIDGVTFAFGMMIALPAALLLTLQPRAWQEVVLSMLGLTAAMAAVEAGGVVLTAIAGGTAVTIATLYPLGFYLLVRAYELGDGRYPHPLFNVLLAVIGIAAAAAAAARAQAAATRREFLGEVIPGFGGFALTAIALGTALGLVAGLILLATASALVACLALLPDRAGIAPLLTIAAAVGLPPGIAFGARAIGIEATFEAGDFLGLIGVAAAAAWATWMVGGARAIGLPGGRGHPAAETFPRVSMLIAALTLISGPALAAIQFGFAAPVAAEAMPSSAGSLGGGLASVVTVSSVLPVVILFVPLLVIGVAIYASTGTSPIRTQARPALFKLPVGSASGRVWAGIRAATVPEQYRSILSVRELEAAAVGASPVLWLAALVALAFAVTR